MNGSDVIDVARDAIGVILLVAGPTMAVALVVGLVIALFQALTQIQEMTLTFVPKIFAIFISLLLFMPMMGDVMNAFTQRLTDRIINGGM